MKLSREQNRVKRHQKIRFKVVGTAICPRLAVHKSLKHLRLQLIDDTKGTTLLSASTVGKESSTVQKAQKIGEGIAKKVVELGIKKIVFDRGGYKYHGQIKAIAEAIRNNGITV